MSCLVATRRNRSSMRIPHNAGNLMKVAFLEGRLPYQRWRKTFNNAEKWNRRSEGLKYYESFEILRIIYTRRKFHSLVSLIRQFSIALWPSLPRHRCLFGSKTFDLTIQEPKRLKPTFSFEYSWPTASCQSVTTSIGSSLPFDPPARESSKTTPGFSLSEIQFNTRIPKNAGVHENLARFRFVNY